MAAVNAVCIEVVIICMPPAGNFSPTNPFTVDVVITACDIMLAIRASFISPVASLDATASCIMLLAILPTDCC